MRPYRHPLLEVVAEYDPFTAPLYQSRLAGTNNEDCSHTIHSLAVYITMCLCDEMHHLSALHTPMAALPES